MQLNSLGQGCITVFETTNAPSQEIAGQYRQFADTAILLRALLHPGGIPPFPRLALNKRLSSEVKLPTSVTLQIDSRGSLVASGLSSNDAAVICIQFTVFILHFGRMIFNELPMRKPAWR